MKNTEATTDQEARRAQTLVDGKPRCIRCGFVASNSRGLTSHLVKHNPA